MNMTQPILIDSLINQLTDPTLVAIQDKWYCARPLTFGGLYGLKQRIYHAWLVLTGRARAYQYMQDRGEV